MIATYWCEKGVITPLVWVESLRWKWAKEKIFFKLLGISFGLNLDGVDVESFIIDKIKKKNVILVFCHLSLVGRAIVLTYSLWYFGAIWGVPPKFLRRSNHYFGTLCGEEHNTQLGLGYGGWEIVPKSPLKGLDYKTLKKLWSHCYANKC